ncbi:hypothetical protein YC2023_090371 [Brassica napus]
MTQLMSLHIDQITNNMYGISKMLKKSSHQPIMDFALSYVEEQEREHMLRGYNEKLATFFWSSQHIRWYTSSVIKNFRISDDCQ